MNTGATRGSIPRLMWPECNAPIVGTRPIVLPSSNIFLRHARNSFTVRKTSIGPFAQGLTIILGRMVPESREDVIFPHEFLCGLGSRVDLRSSRLSIKVCIISTQHTAQPEEAVTAQHSTNYTKRWHFRTLTSCLR